MFVVVNHQLCPNAKQCLKSWFFEQLIQRLIQNCYFISFFKICCTDCQEIPNTAAAFLVDFPGLLSNTNTFNILWCTNIG